MALTVSVNANADKRLKNTEVTKEKDFDSALLLLVYVTQTNTQRSQFRRILWKRTFLAPGGQMK